MSGNYILTTGALMLLGFFILTNNTVITRNALLEQETSYSLTAIALAQSLIEEVKMKSFDEATISTAISSTALLTSPVLLGTDGGFEVFRSPDTETGGIFRSTTIYDDVDDYNNYRRTVSTPTAGNFTVSSTVTYVDINNPSSVSAAQTWAKKITVTVTNTFMPDFVSLEYVFAY
ncbi:MAG: hypothetical protein HUU43_10005 [Ignavibacteriaceae bacterium]|nr:hypothetical protein [Ignavibacteriaceae bacterium]NUM71172.1 hypothetical protein [Ignavibacteriaceae bacterium]